MRTIPVSQAVMATIPVSRAATIPGPRMRMPMRVVKTTPLPRVTTKETPMAAATASARQTRSTRVGSREAATAQPAHRRPLSRGWFRLSDWFGADATSSRRSGRHPTRPRPYSSGEDLRRPCCLSPRVARARSPAEENLTRPSVHTGHSCLQRHSCCRLGGRQSVLHQRPSYHEPRRRLDRSAQSAPSR